MNTKTILFLGIAALLLGAEMYEKMTRPRDDFFARQDFALKQLCLSAKYKSLPNPARGDDGGVDAAPVNVIIGCTLILADRNSTHDDRLLAYSNRAQSVSTSNVGLAQNDTKAALEMEPGRRWVAALLHMRGAIAVLDASNNGAVCPEDAVRELSRSIELDKGQQGEAVTHAWLADCFVLQKKYTEAIAEIEEAIKLDPINTSSYRVQKAEFLVDAGDKNKALTYMKSYIEHADREQQIKFITLAAGWNQPRHALGVCRAAETSRPKEWDMLGNCAIVFEQAGEREQAIRYYCKTIDLVKAVVNNPVSGAGDYAAAEDFLKNSREGLKRLGSQ